MVTPDPKFSGIINASITLFLLIRICANHYLSRQMDASKKRVVTVGVAAMDSSVTQNSCPEYQLPSIIEMMTKRNVFTTQLELKYRLCQKQLYNFQFLIAERVSKGRQQHFSGHNYNFPVCKKILNGIIPWSGVKVMVLWVMSGKNKVGYFRH